MKSRLSVLCTRLTWSIAQHVRGYPRGMCIMNDDNARVRSIRKASPWKTQSMRIVRIKIRKAPGCVPVVLTALEASESSVYDLW
jgi:hypothetical protein